jgi:hypothetical protein
MRKRLITPIPQSVQLADEGWPNLDRAAAVEITSEEKGYPVEAPLISGEKRGCRAADSGAQTIRLVFDESQVLRRIALVFEETEIERVVRAPRSTRTPPSKWIHRPSLRRENHFLGKLSVEPETLSVHDAVSDVLNTLRGNAIARGVSLSSELPPVYPWLMRSNSPATDSDHPRRQRNQVYSPEWYREGSNSAMGEGPRVSVY